MRLLEVFASAFISTFGMAQPTDATRRRAAWFIVGMLLLVVIGIGAVAAFLYRTIRG